MTNAHLSSPPLMSADHRRSAILDINGKLLSCFLFGIGAYWIWPSSIAWWGFATHSIVLGLGSFVALIAALRAMIKLRRTERLLKAYEEQGSGPKGARLADDEALIAAGMQDREPQPSSGLAGSLRTLLRGRAS